LSHLYAIHTIAGMVVLHKIIIRFCKSSQCFHAVTLCKGSWSPGALLPRKELQSKLKLLTWSQRC